MNAAQVATPASTAAPTPTEATCAAVREASSEPDKGEETHKRKEMPGVSHLGIEEKIHA